LAFPGRLGAKQKGHSGILVALVLGVVLLACVVIMVIQAVKKPLPAASNTPPKVVRPKTLNEPRSIIEEKADSFVGDVERIKQGDILGRVPDKRQPVVQTKKPPNNSAVIYREERGAGDPGDYYSETGNFQTGR